VLWNAGAFCFQGRSHVANLTRAISLLARLRAGDAIFLLSCSISPQPLAREPDSHIACSSGDSGPSGHWFGGRVCPLLALRSRQTSDLSLRGPQAQPVGLAHVKSEPHLGQAFPRMFPLHGTNLPHGQRRHSVTPFVFLLAVLGGRIANLRVLRPPPLISFAIVPILTGKPLALLSPMTRWTLSPFSKLHHGTNGTYGADFQVNCRFRFSALGLTGKVLPFVPPLPLRPPPLPSL
jgi:hypothetical protein